MNLLRWFKSKFEMAPLNRVAAVTCDDQGINVQWAKGSTNSSTWDDIERVLIRTTDQGPFDDDVSFVIETAEGSFVIPQAAPGASQLLERLQQLPGFNNEAVIDSMGCTDNSVFVCWERRTLQSDWKNAIAEYEFESIESTIQANRIAWSCSCGASLGIEFQIYENGVGYPQKGNHDWVTGGVSVPCPECGRRFFLPCMATSPCVSGAVAKDHSLRSGIDAWAGKNDK